MTAITRRMLASVAAAAGIAAPVVGGIALATAAPAPAQPLHGSMISQDGDDETPTPVVPVVGGSADVNIGIPVPEVEIKQGDGDDKDEEKKPSVDAIQTVLDKIKDAKSPSELADQLDEDITKLKENAPAVPSSVTKDYEKFQDSLEDAKAEDSLKGDKAADTLKKIQSDAATLSGQLKAAS